MPQLLNPTCLEPLLRNKRSHRNKSAHRNEEQPLLAATRESPCTAMKTQCSQKQNKTHLFSHSSAVDKSKISVTGPKSRGQEGLAPSILTREESGLCFFPLIRAAPSTGLEARHPSLCLHCHTALSPSFYVKSHCTSILKEYV